MSTDLSDVYPPGDKIKNKILKDKTKDFPTSISDSHLNVSVAFLDFASLMFPYMRIQKNKVEARRIALKNFVDIQKENFRSAQDLLPRFRSRNSQNVLACTNK